MSAGWAIRLDRADAPAAGGLRGRAGVEVREEGASVWLRGPAFAYPEGDIELRTLPAVERYSIIEDGGLVPPGGAVPRGRLPGDGWRPMSSWLVLEPQVAALPGERPATVEVRVVRGGEEREACVLVADGAAFHAWADVAPDVRLRPLELAVDGARALVRGRPLPPIPGERFVADGGIAVPCGHRWDPPIEAGVLRAVLDVEAGGLALLAPGGTVERVPAAAFVTATRSAVRRSLGAAP